MRIIKIFYLFFIALTFMVVTVGCGDVQNEYYEVHQITVDDQPFYYIDPYDGKDTLKANSLGTGESMFIYMYETPEDDIFRADQYYINIGFHFVETNVATGKLYILSSVEIDNLITQFCIDQDAWESTQT